MTDAKKKRGLAASSAKTRHRVSLLGAAGRAKKRQQLAEKARLYDEQMQALKEGE